MTQREELLSVPKRKWDDELQNMSEYERGEYELLVLLSSAWYGKFNAGSTG